jgi:hypothetical protein
MTCAPQAPSASRVAGGTRSTGGSSSRKHWVGWTVNLGALAVLTHLVHTDDEDVPFGAAPPRIVAATLVFPLVAFVAFTALAAESWSHLPARVPTHWGISGEADGYGSRVSTLLFLSVMTAVPVALAGSTCAGARR